MLFNFTIEFVIVNMCESILGGVENFKRIMARKEVKYILQKVKLKLRSHNKNIKNEMFRTRDENTSPEKAIMLGITAGTGKREASYAVDGRQ